MGERFRVGFLVNPIAGLGGRPGYKGSDDPERVAELVESTEFLDLPANQRALDFLTDIVLTKGVAVTAPGPLGETILKRSMMCGGPIFEVAREPGWNKRIGQTTREDTVFFAKRLLREQLDLLVFVGGDGTAVDVAQAVEKKVPVLGVPAGVKMFSGVFAETAIVARNLVKDLRPGFASSPVEVIDLDESSYQAGEWRVKALAEALVPVATGVQVSKGGTIATEAESEADLVEWFRQAYEPDTTYVLAAGTTVGAIKRHLGGGSALGVDVYRGGVFVVTDAGEERLLTALDGAEKVQLILSPTARQGALLGRGTAQISPSVLERIGLDNLVVLATPGKLLGLDSLFVDTGDAALDAQFPSYVKIRTDPLTEKVFRVRAGAKPDGHRDR